MMAFPHFLKRLHPTGWEFWLPLPLIAVLFWNTGHLITAKVLSRPYDSVNKLKLHRQVDVQFSDTILAINANIDHPNGITTILIKTTNSTPKKLELPVTEVSQIEAKLSQDLEMSVEAVRKLVSYRITDSDP